MLTGRQDPTLVVPRNQRNRSDFPGVGSVASYFSPPGDMPAAVTVPRPIGHDGVTYSGTHAGFLGPRHDPMELQSAPNASEQAVHAVSLPGDVDAGRLLARRGLLRHDRGRRTRLCRRHGPRKGLTASTSRRCAWSLRRRRKKAFNLDLEPPAVRDATAATSTARACCWRGGWSRPACAS